MHPSQGTAHNPSQGTAQGRQAVGSWHRQGPDQPPLGVHRQHPQRKHDSAAPSKTALVQAWGCPASPRQTVSLTVKPYWCHQMQPPCQWHSGWLPCVGTLPGPLPKTPVTSPGPDQGTGPRQVSATLPKVCGVQSCWWPPCHPGGRLQGRGRGLWQQRREQGQMWAAAVAYTVVTLQMILGL